MKAKMITISSPKVGKKEINLVTEVLKSGQLVQGPKVKLLEEEFIKLTNTKYAVATNNGTSALHSALYAIGITTGDEVITTPFTFIATANSILMQGGVPVFADIDEKTFNIDPKSIEQLINKRTKAILVVNLYGQSADYNEINRIARKHNLIVIEDAAQSVSAKFGDKTSGNLADIACFSLYATKNLMCVEGGMVTTNNKDYYEKVKLFRHHGQSETKRYFYHDIGYNYRLSDLHAAIGLCQFQTLEEMNKKRRSIANKYDKALKGLKGIITPYVDPLSEHVYHQYTLRITEDYKHTRDEFQDLLLENDIQTNIYYPIPLYEFDHLEMGLRSKLPVTEKITKQVVSIPVHPNLSEQDVEKIINTIKSIS
jgi:dTDP-4-amino-4,6-dideoxygalactose transaminase